MVSGAGAEPRETIRLMVDGVEREALASLPADPNIGKHPLIFAFHGHGGMAAIAAAKFECQVYWPEAIVIYPQGLKTPGGIVDPEGKRSGWQKNLGDMGDRDLRFFDALLEHLTRSYSIDPSKVFVLGHSNGGLFAYEIWEARPEAVAGIAAIAAIIPTSAKRKAFVPRPVFHVAGKNDPLVLYAWQAETMRFVHGLNRCGGAAMDFAEGQRIFDSPLGAPLGVFVHGGGHEVPEGAIARIIHFFRLEYRYPPRT